MDSTNSATTFSSELAAQDCYHCGLPVPVGSDFFVSIEGRDRAMCCPGCQAVATAIVDGGLGNFYRYRATSGVAEGGLRPESQTDTRRWQVFDLDEVQVDFVVRETDESGAERRQAQLLIEGITCAACVWLIEHHLGKIPGVLGIKVNASSHRCSLRWDPSRQNLSVLMGELAAIGYLPQPATDDRQQELWKRENRQALMRLGVAGFGMMQVGMVAIALYAGGLQGIAHNWEHYLRWISLLIATPVVGYSARPFFNAAWRSLRTRHLSMDVPVSIAIAGAFLASCWATLFGGGEVYFDSVSMFTFFLLLGRYLEMRARHHNSVATGNMAQLMPLTARRLIVGDGAENGSAGEQDVPLKSLQPGDRVLVKSGETLPCDGIVVAGRSEVVEALLTGEPLPVSKAAGDRVAAGTLNSDSALTVEVTAVGAATQLSAIERLVNQAEADKPGQVALADRMAGYFVAAVLLIAVVVFTLWSWLEPSRALWITLSVLVVTCPCALSLATPAALTAATASLRREGLLVTRGHVIESLNRVTRVVFDKTGTLTLGEVRLEDTRLLDQAVDTRFAQSVAKALEQESNHPIANAFAALNNVEVAEIKAGSLRQVTAAGVEGVVVGGVGGEITYRLGAPTFVSAIFTEPGSVPIIEPGDGKQWLLLGCEQGPIAWFALSDQLRDSARPLVGRLKSAGLGVELLSGDKSAAVAALATELGIDNYRAGVTPDDKLAHIRQLQSEGEIVLMVGDGINDVPVLSGADVSVAMASATDLAQTRADSVLLHGDLMVIDRAMAIARRGRRIIRQNLGWALAYNGLALPLAALGWVPPYAAAIGMSASSLVVIANALRLNK